MDQVDVQHVLLGHKKHEVDYGRQGQKELLGQAKVQKIKGKGVQHGDQPDEDAAEYEHTDGIPGQIVGKAGGRYGKVSQCSHLEKAERADEVGPGQGFLA